MKIQEALYKSIPFNFVESSKKVDTISTGQIAVTDSYALGESSPRVEDILLRLLKDIALDLTNGIGVHEPDCEDQTAAVSPGARVFEESSGKVASTSPDGLNTDEFRDRAGDTSGHVAESLTGRAAFGGEEIIKSLAMNSLTMNTPLQLPDNDVIIKNITLFVDSVNALLDGSTVVDKTFSDTPVEMETGSLSNKKDLLGQLTLEKGLCLTIQTAAKKIIFQDEEFQNFQSIGLSIDKNNLFHLDVPGLEEALTSKKEETLNAIKGIGSLLYEKANFLANPYAGSYAVDKNILQLRASQKNEGTLLLDKKMKEEQDVLEKRLNELQLLIERSRLLQDWFSEDNKIQVTDNA